MLIQVVTVKDDRVLCTPENTISAATVLDLSMRALGEWSSAIMIPTKTMTTPEQQK